MGANAVALKATRQATRAERRNENLAMVILFYILLLCEERKVMGERGARLLFHFVLLSLMVDAEKRGFFVSNVVLILLRGDIIRCV